jgi:predicted DNA-binding protein
MKKEKKTISVRLESEIIKKIDKIAIINNRDRSKEINDILEKHIKKIERNTLYKKSFFINRISPRF